LPFLFAESKKKLTQFFEKTCEIICCFVIIGYILVTHETML